MARKDARLMLEEGARHGARYDVLPQIAAVFDRAIAAGHGAQDIGVIAAV
jgi:3-hydroxyisobutyrate dehydrogenase